MSQLFINKNIIVTGGSMGIGAAAVDAFYQEGGNVIILDINEPADWSQNKYEGRVHFIRCDVSESEEVKTAFEKIRNKWETTDVLINNAGIQTYGTATTTTEEVWDKTMAVNLKSMFLCAKFCIPLMVQQPAPVIVNVSSVQGFVSQKEVLAYATSKAAIAGLTRSIAIDYAPQIRCVAVSPGAVNTPMLQADIDKLPGKDAKEAALKETREIRCNGQKVGFF